MTSPLSLQISPLFPHCYCIGINGTAPLGVHLPESLIIDIVTFNASAITQRGVIDAVQKLLLKNWISSPLSMFRMEN